MTHWFIRSAAALLLSAAAGLASAAVPADFVDPAAPEAATGAGRESALAYAEAVSKRIYCTDGRNCNEAEIRNFMSRSRKAYGALTRLAQPDIWEKTLSGYCGLMGICQYPALKRDYESRCRRAGKEAYRERE